MSRAEVGPDRDVERVTPSPPTERQAKKAAPEGATWTTSLCVISFKQCWQDESGRWMSYGGFPCQMDAVGSLFDQMTLLIERGAARAGGLPLPELAEIVVLPSPVGTDGRRKLSLLARLPYYLAKIGRHVAQADVVHSPVPGDMPLLGMLMALMLRRRLLVRYGGSWRGSSRTTFMNRVTRTLMRRFAGGRNVMLATGEGDEPPAPGMHWIFSTALTRDELSGIQPDLDRGLCDPPRLVYVGRLAPEKGVPVLVRAVANLKRDGFQPLPSVTLVGDGPQRQEIESQITQLGVETQFRLTGQLDRTSLSSELMRQDVCVQPSYTEGFSKAWLDAFAHGLPVLASEVGAAAGVLGEEGQRGWLTTPGDADQLADRIGQVVGQSHPWPQLRRRCREFVEGRTLEAWSQQIGRICADQWRMSLRDGKLRL